MSYILLSSAKHDAPNTRSFNEFKTSDEIAKALISHFEAYLLTREKIEKGNTEEQEDDDSLEYRDDELYKFLDEFFHELCCLVRQDDDPNLWIPYPKDWVKEHCIYLYFKKQNDNVNSNKFDPKIPPSLASSGATNMDIDRVH